MEASTHNSGEKKRYYPKTEDGKYFMMDRTIVDSIDDAVWFHSPEEAIAFESPESAKEEKTKKEKAEPAKES